MIVTVTLNPAVDHTVHLQGDLEPGGVNRTSMSQYDAGGKGINVSKYLRELGLDTVATGLTGGFLGRYIEEQLDRAKIENDFVQMGGCTRLNTTILGDEQEYKLNQPGHRVKAATVREAISKISEYDPELVVVAGSLPTNLGPATIDRIACAGPWETVVDVQGDLLKGLSVEYSLCKPNRDELAVATGQPVATIEECCAAAESLRAEGFDRVVASLGADGAILASADGTYHADAQDAQVVDTVGAGDALLAGALAALTTGRSERAALRFGIATAARVVSVPGTTVPDMSDVHSEAVEIPLLVQ